MKGLLNKRLKSAVAVLLALSVFCLGGCSSKDNTDEPAPVVDYTAISENANKISAYDVEAANYSLDVDASKEIRDISDLLYGIFFEDINFAGDGGLYAEKVANRSFEFTQLAKDDSLYAWSVVGSAVISVKNDDGLNENNPSYCFIEATEDNTGIANRGFLEGMSIEKDMTYNFSIYAKGIDGYKGGLTIRLMAGDEVAGEATIDGITDSWAKYTATLKSTITSKENVTLQVLVNAGNVAVDMVSLFPENTYKNRENGVREDIATLLADLQPKFLRFPGGCVIEGYDAKTAYSWKDSIGVGSDGKPLEFNGTYGDVAARKQGIDIWTDMNATDDEYPSFMTYGLGFYEFFQLSEDIGAVGVPVLNAGVYCQGRGGSGVDMSSDEFKGYIQDMLDLVEFCRGGADSTFGKVRIALGHEKPFELKYICIGNENEGEQYYERYSAFLDAFNKAKKDDPELYKGLELIYSAGTADGTSSENYLKSYAYAKKQLGDSKNAKDFAGATDQHYYNEPEWFLRNADYYDEANYSRNVADMDKNYGGGINVFLGEYASRSNTLNSALSEAAYMTGLERNGDIVRMATYAPLLSSVTARHWAPNLIWFDNSSSIGSISYYTQKLFSTNAGTKLLSSELKGADHKNYELAGKVGLGTWNTSAEFDNVKIVDNKTGDILAQDDFSKNSFKKSWEQITDADFKVKGGVLKQSKIDAEYNDLGQVAYFGDNSWTNYTFTVDATKLDGQEGFLIPFAVNDAQNNFFWNIGGWGDTVSCLQEVSNGVKTGQVKGTVKDIVIETGKTYQLKVEINGNNVKCYVNDELYIDYTAFQDARADAYQVVSTDETGDIIIKLVNVTDDDKVFAIDLKGVTGDKVSDKAKAYQVAGSDLVADNIFGQDEHHIKMNELELDGISNQFNYTAPKYSATVIRISK